MFAISSGHLVWKQILQCKFVEDTCKYNKRCPKLNIFIALRSHSDGGEEPQKINQRRLLRLQVPP